MELLINIQKFDIKLTGYCVNMTGNINTCFNGLDLKKYRKITLYQRRFDDGHCYYWDEFLEYFNFNFHKAYDCWNLSTVNHLEFYNRFPEYVKDSINNSNQPKFLNQNINDLTKLDKKHWFKLKLPEIIDFSNNLLLPEDLIVCIGDFTDLINFRLINKNIFTKTQDKFVYKYINNLYHLDKILIYLKSLNIKPTPQASYIYYTSKINPKKSPCNAITKKGSFCKNLTFGNQKCHCHKVGNI